MKRALKAFATGFGIGLAFVFAALLVLSYRYRDRLALLVMQKINENIKTRVEVKQVRFTVLRKFPQASLELRDVLVLSPAAYVHDSIALYNDTLLYARKLYLQFNLFDLLNKRYVISTVHLDKASLHLYVNQQGENNFNVVKESKAPSEGPLRIDLKNVKITRTHVLFYNQYKKLLVSVNSHNSLIKLNLNNEKLSLTLKSDIGLDSIQAGDLTLLAGTEALINGKIQSSEGIHRIEEGEIKLGEQIFAFSGDFSTRDKDGVLMDFRATGKKLNIGSMLSSLPVAMQRRLNLDAGGELFFEATAKGRWNALEYPRIRAQFGIRQGTITRNGITFSQVNTTGYFDNGRERTLASSTLSLEPFSFQMENEKVNGRVRVVNFNSPAGIAEISASVNLKKINQFFSLPSLSDEEGKINANIKVKFEAGKNKDLSNNQLNITAVSGTLEFLKAGFRWKPFPAKFSDLNGTVEINGMVQLKKFSAKINNNDFFMNLSVVHLFEYLNHKDTLYITGTVSSQYLNYNELTEAFSGKSSAGGALLLPDSVKINLGLSAASFKWDNLLCTGASAKITYLPFRFSVHDASFNALDGKVTGSIVLWQDRQKNLSLSIRSSLNRLSISKLFESFNNFGQNEITDKHLKGMVSGNVDYLSVWNEKGEWLPGKLECFAGIEIVNGQILDCRTLLALARYIDVAELKNLHFATLKNSIYIKDKTVTIPRMDIVSNAIDLNFSGTHTFDNEYEYHIVVALSDVLWGKARKKETAMYGEEGENNRTKLPLIITGKGENYKIGYDRRRAREEFSEKVSREKQEVKTLLHQELGLFAGDTSLAKPPVNVSTQKIRIDWEEETKNPSDTPSSAPATSSQKKKIEVEWDDR